MTQTAVVEQRLAHGLTQVRVLQRSACGHDCEQCGGGCGSSRVLRLQAKDPLGAEPGDTVTLETGTGKVLGAAALVYLLPLLTLFSSIGGAVLLKLGEGGTALVGLGGLLLGCCLAAAINRWLRQDRPLEYTIIAVERRDDVR